MNMKDFLTRARDNEKWDEYTSEELFEDAMDYYIETKEKFFPVEDYELLRWVTRRNKDKYNFKDLPLELALVSERQHTRYQQLVIMQKLIETPKEEIVQNPEYWEDYFVFNILAEDDDRKDLDILDILLKKECVELLTSDLFDYDTMSNKWFIDLSGNDEFFDFPIEHAEEIEKIKKQNHSEEYIEKYNEMKNDVKVLTKRKK